MSVLDSDQVPAVTATLNRYEKKVFVPSAGLPTFTLPAPMNPVVADPVNNLEVFRNGQLLALGTDYSYAASTQAVSFVTLPKAGDVMLFVSYQ